MSMKMELYTYTRDARELVDDGGSEETRASLDRKESCCQSAMRERTEPKTVTFEQETMSSSQVYHHVPTLFRSIVVRTFPPRTLHKLTLLAGRIDEGQVNLHINKIYSRNGILECLPLVPSVATCNIRKQSDHLSLPDCL